MGNSEIENTPANLVIVNESYQRDNREDVLENCALFEIEINRANIARRQAEGM